MGDMAEEFNAIREVGKEHKKSQAQHVLEYLYKFSLENTIGLECMNKESHYWRLTFNGYDVDVWCSTVKFTVVKSGKYSQGLRRLKTLLEKKLKAHNQAKGVD